MHTFRRLMAVMTYLTFLLTPIMAFAAEGAQTSVRHTGVSAFWILANISYAGMRAQSNPSVGWRIVAFIFGFPGTLLSFFVVDEGRGRAYGIELPKTRL